MFDTAQAPPDGARIPDAGRTFTARSQRTPGAGSWFGQLAAAVFLHPVTMFLVRRLCPNVFLPVLRFRVISRYDDAREALQRPDVFGVPWAAKMRMQSPSREPFILATDDPASHACAQARIMKVFRDDQADNERIATVAAETAQTCVDRGRTEFDVVHDLFNEVQRAVYRDYFGIEAPEALVPSLIDISNYTFRKIGADPGRADALAGIAVAGELVDAAIEQAKRGDRRDTIATRLVALQRSAPDRFPDDALRSTFIGMVAGYAPVATTAARNIVDVLLRNGGAMELTRQAVEDDDDALLLRCLLEALRFAPINPGLWRICRQDYTLAVGTSRETRLRAGDHLLVFLRSAMRDETALDRPWRFDPKRPPSHSMVFGYGMHWCTGAPLAIAQLTPMFKPLLQRGFQRVPQRSGGPALLVRLDPR